MKGGEGRRPEAFLGLCYNNRSLKGEAETQDKMTDPRAA